MALMIPGQDTDFNFNSARNSPYPSAPSTPRRFGECYFSAPPSPSRNLDFYGEFDDYMVSSSDTIVKIGHGSSTDQGHEFSSLAYTRNGDDFAFDVGEEVEGKGTISAEELFDGGVIKPMEPLSRSQQSGGTRKGELTAQNFIRSYELEGKKAVDKDFSPKQKKELDRASDYHGRGRERGLSISSSSRRATRSLSPSRLYHEQYPCEENQDLLPNNKNHPGKSSATSSSTSSKSQKKWRFRDLFLFRNASEGRASDKDVLRKYTATYRVIDTPTASNASSSGGGGSSSRRKGPVSAHELHYTENRAAREVLKKKTFLPYKGVWGRMPFNAALANGLFG